ncbi:TRAP transporter small permease subunit [Basilea psittacipulmonis]|uniref:TRAP transporter small permease protein n=1 Tax=Basilea psittacipulmonis DSM 24701 TaxID=1072685 RepID=A0A077DI98_9BURK|nr:TRAP transporter small permease subunit [Basilea psittacipulmonis]AIL32888.1 C4-dicarboxylate ABC transporter substrate-binding protein [Basilea psittacipulmonis DSM 24701]
MKFLLNISKLIDKLNSMMGVVVTWLALLVVLISAGNAIVRKLFNESSNAWLEIQWYLFGAIFLLGAAYTFLKNEHVRVDILSQRFSKKTQTYIDIVGTVFFLIPICFLIVWLSIPFFWDSFVSGELSSNSGGLIRWPVKLLIPVGFFLLELQAFSHLIKCVAYLKGLVPDPLQRETAEEAIEAEIQSIKS